MKPAPFEYFAPESLDSAIQIMDRHGSDARLLAGGQSLIASMNFRCLTPSFLVDLNVLTGLDEIRTGLDGELKIGAMARYRALERDPVVAGFAPIIHTAIPYIAHTAIRTRGTIGGNLAYADPASELPAVTLALGARYKAVRAGAERWIAADDFFRASFVTALDPREILVEVSIPPAQPRTGWAFHEIARRQGDRVMMGVAAVVTLDESGICRQARLAYQNAAPTPVLARSASQLLIGAKPGDAIIRAAAHQAAYTDIDPPDDVHASRAFRRHLAEELTCRTLFQAFTQLGAL